MPYSEAEFAREFDVSRETLDAMRAWHTLLAKWNARINLVASGEVERFWERHALDSWQLVRLLPARVASVIDLGSGAGFPGVAVAQALKVRSEGRVLCVEAAGKKANFLRTVARELALPLDVTSERAESLPAQGFDVVTARAFAPLPRLLAYAERFWGKATVGLFPKGERAAGELAEASRAWRFHVKHYPSRSSETGTILEISGLQRVDAVAPGGAGGQSPTRL